MILDAVKIKENNFFVTKKKDYVPAIKFSKEELVDYIKFAYSMSFGDEGQHRAHRSGGTHQRKKGEIFCDAFQGKLAELGLYKVFSKHGIKLDTPNLETWTLGVWDITDFEYKGRKLNLKSTKWFGNLLLLETKDWSDEGVYTPNDIAYDFFILMRIKPEASKLLKTKNLLYCNHAKYIQIEELINSENWSCDIAGWVSRDQVKEVIRSKFIVKKGMLINGKYPLDADNYYIQAGNLLEISKLIEMIKAWN